MRPDVSILILLDTGWKPTAAASVARIGAVSILILLDTGWKPKAFRRPANIDGVSILILLDTGWKPIPHIAIENPVSGFNPHLTGYGLEEVANTEAIALLKFQSSSYWIRAGRMCYGYKQLSSMIVSILILLDTGWKKRVKSSATTILTVSILILLDTGWKRRRC